MTLDNGKPCVLHEGGGVLVDFGRQLHGGVQILIGRMKDQPPTRLRLRFGESVSEAMSDLGGAKNATADHAVRVGCALHTKTRARCAVHTLLHGNADICLLSSPGKVLQIPATGGWCYAAGIRMLWGR